MKHQLIIFLLCLSTACRNGSKTEPAATATDSHAGHTNVSASAEQYIDQLNTGSIGRDTLKGSPARVAMVNLEGQHIHLAYGSPGVKDRIIWGGLVPYGQVWVTGAHQATQISFTSPVEIQGKQIPAGIYALFTIPDSNKWTIILNKNHDQHLTDEYNESEDVWRGMVSTTSSDTLIQRLTYSFLKKDKHAALLQFAWERMRFDLPINNAAKP